MTYINDPPWVVEIDGIKFATPEAVVILLQSVSEERDELRKALIYVGMCPTLCDEHQEILQEALDAE